MVDYKKIIVMESARLRKGIAIVLCIAILIPFIMVISFQNPLGKYVIWLMPLVGFIGLVYILFNWDTFGVPKKYRNKKW